MRTRFGVIYQISVEIGGSDLLGDEAAALEFPESDCGAEELGFEIDLLRCLPVVLV